MKLKYYTLSVLLIFSMFSTVVAGNSPPVVNIKIPENGIQFKTGEMVKFEATARDLEDGELSGKSLVWTSDLDGQIGEGSSFSYRPSEGFHIIIVNATDSDKGISRASAFITVNGHKAKQPAKKPEPEDLSGITNAASIELTYVPPYGNNRNLTGVVKNSKPSNLAVAVYIMVDGTWWTKPYWAEPITKVSSDGTWMCDITTGGVDTTATMIVAYVIPAGYKPPMVSGNYRLPDEIEKRAVARVEVKRSPSGKMSVAGGKNAPKLREVKLSGVCYCPFRDNQNPDKGVFPTNDEMWADLKLIPCVAKAVRTYGSTNTPGIIPSLCGDAGIDCYPGAWLGKDKSNNAKEINALIGISGTTRTMGLIVGNEVLLRRDLTMDELIGYIRKVKASTTLPVSTAEIWSTWIEYPKLYGEVDFVIVHIHPYWEGIAANEAAEHVVNMWRYMKAMFPDKRVVIGETGWPSEGKQVGNAVPSPENQALFFREFTEFAEKENIEYFWFELFDEKWKTKFEGKDGAYWGIYNSGGSLKEHMKGMVPKEASSIKRTPGKVSRDGHVEAGCKNIVKTRLCRSGMR